MSEEARAFVCNPDISEGALCFEGTRIPVRAVKDFARAGYFPEAIVREYPSLSIADVEAAIAYKIIPEPMPLAMTLLVEHVETLIAVAKEAEHLVSEAEWQIVESIEAEVAQVKAMAGRG